MQTENQYMTLVMWDGDTRHDGCFVFMTSLILVFNKDLLSYWVWDFSFNA